jgi:hypothetical protein
MEGRKLIAYGVEISDGIDLKGEKLHHENASDDGKKRAGDFFRKPGCDDKNSQAYEAHDQRVCIECMDAC